MRIANVAQGMGVLALINFSEQNGVYTATQRVQTAVGTVAVGGVPNPTNLIEASDIFRGINLFEIELVVRLGA